MFQTRKYLLFGHINSRWKSVSSYKCGIYGTVRRACAAIHSHAFFSEENLPNKRTEPFGAVICTRHDWPFRTVANIAI